MSTILKILLTILNNHRTINIATVIIVIISGLYASYSGLLGRPSGFLRQLLVGIPLGFILGILSYVTDVNGTFSNIIKRLIQAPAITISSLTIPISPITIAVLGFANGLAIALIIPNVLRTDQEEWEEVSTPTLFLLFLFVLFFGPLWGSLGILTLFQILQPWLHFHPSLLVALATALLLSILLFFRVLNKTAKVLRITSLLWKRIYPIVSRNNYAVLFSPID